MTLLQQMERERHRLRENLRHEVLRALRQLLRQTIAGQKVVVFGSLIRPGRFHDQSDVDIAIERETPGMTLYQLTALLCEGLGRPVDVLLLDECRFREKILQQGQTWTLLD